MICQSKHLLNILLFLFIFLVITTCTEEEHITEVNFEKIEFASFVEKEFPFITTSLLVGGKGALNPKKNAVSRCLALNLGDDSYVCFDTNMLRWAAAWTGDFVPLDGVSQVSYSDFISRNKNMPYLTDVPDLVTGLYPGWNVNSPQFTDPRPPSPHSSEPSWGPLPQEIGRWNGIYLTTEGPVLSYTVGSSDIYEKPESIGGEQGETVFTRSFSIQDQTEILVLAAAEVPASVQLKHSLDGGVTLQEEETGITHYFALKNAGPDAELVLKDERYVMVQVDGEDKNIEFILASWKGESDGLEQAKKLISHAEFSMPEVRKGGFNPWPGHVFTRGKVSADTSAYVVDRLTLPIPNPWRRNVRVVDIDFFEDGRAVVVTFEGDVWIVEGIDKSLKHLQWTRFASGLYETQSIEVVNDEIYTYGKEGIVRLHDFDGDGAADYYENFSNLMAQSLETREWAGDMVSKPDGGFYITKGGALNAGPEAFTGEVVRGFRAGSRHNGIVMDISRDGRSAEIFATGFRGPFLGIHPKTGLLTASDQEGNFVPSTPIMIVEKGDYFGVAATAHRSPEPKITPPLLWIPHSVDRSGISQLWVSGGEMGPLNNDLIHFSYGRPGLFRILMDSTTSQVQGGATFIDADYPVPTMKGNISPKDGQIYFAGFTLWGTNSEGWTGLSRLRYTGSQSRMLSDFKARKRGLILQFDTHLDEKTITDISNYRLERWNYKRTSSYGSGHFQLNGKPGQENIPITSVFLSEDRKSVFLAIPVMKPVDQMQLSYQIKAADGTTMDDQFWFTVHHLEDMNLVAEGFKDVDTENLFVDVEHQVTTKNNVKEVSIERGKQLFERLGCRGCHTIDGSEGAGVAPTLKGLIGKERIFKDGSTLIADEEYIRQELLTPGKRVLEGYEEGMPSFLGILSKEETESIILYIKSL